MVDAKDHTDRGAIDRAKRFAENVSRLMALKRQERGETISQFADRVGLPYGWLRRVSTAGVRQTSKRTLPMLKQLASELGVSSYMTLWESIPVEIDADEVVAAMKRDHPREWSLYVTLKWKVANTSNRFFKSGEEDAEISVGLSIFRWLRENENAPVTVEELAQFCAKGIRDTYDVVRRDAMSQNDNGS